MTKFIKSFIADESGAVASEYAILLVLIALVLVLAVTNLQGAISEGINRVAEVITNAAS